MFRSTIATTLRRAGEPRRRRVAAGGMLLGSLGLLGGVWVTLPSNAPRAPAIEEVPTPAGPSDLLSGSDQLRLPLPDGEPIRVRTVVRHLRPAVEILDVAVVNNDQVSVELSSNGPPDTTTLVVTSTAIHHCDRYAGSIIVTARHPDVRREHLFIDLRFADCEGVSAVPAAPSSVNDTSRTWGDEGRAPWVPRQPVHPDPEPEPAPTETPSSEPTSDPTPTAEPSPTREPTPQPTGEPEPTAPPPSDESTSGDGGSDGGGGSGGGETSTGSDGDTTGDTTDETADGTTQQDTRAESTDGDATG